MFKTLLIIAALTSFFIWQSIQLATFINSRLEPLLAALGTIQ